MALIRCVLVLVTLAASGVASATLTYDYPNGVLFDSSTNLYWRSGPQNASGWQVATGQQVTSLFSEVAPWSFVLPPNNPATFSNVVADLVLFFSTGAPSPRPIAGSLPLGNLGDPTPGCFPPCAGLLYGVFQWRMDTANPNDGFDLLSFGYSGSANVGLNDWVTSTVSTIGGYGRPNAPPQFALPSDAVFYLVSPTNPVPEAETYAMLLAGLGLLGLVARRRKLKAA